jgi:hypothetical protein
MAIGGVFEKGGNQKVARPTIIVRLKMEGAYIFAT